MSWSLSFESREDLANDAPKHGTIPDKGTPARDQYEAARNAAFVLIGSGSVGEPPVREFGISLTGHANPDHAPAPGYANDCVGINIYQKSPVVAPAA